MTKILPCANAVYIKPVEYEGAGFNIGKHGDYEVIGNIHENPELMEK